ncbi:DUF3574 domain-containing protein [Caldimonas brevitalea]|uniref:Lipoprotein n=1 Tax=Caldimonas brevitalea TaxID=413882 RepID=A0A0G3BN79_9BURK|nr:DUF3574 domain-containing protein [Caldimonas brevitalea]AKJ29448.1 lipoprotein [Caldimonas brevitalea]
MTCFRLCPPLALALALGACASVPPPDCRTGEQPAIADTLYFGTARPGGTVSREAWEMFVNREVTPRFPKGLTSWQASGQWQGANGAIERETAHVLQVVHPDSAAGDRAIRDLVSLYKTSFEQEAVLRVRTRACVSF